MKTKLLIGSTIFILIASLGIFVYATFQDAGGLAKVRNINLSEVKEQISTPPILKNVLDQKSEPLSVSGIISLTNKERETIGLAALIQNKGLNQAAAMKLSDMVSKNYFEHVSPEGKDAAYFVNASNYSYIVLGENLALGNFDGDKGVVRAWMESPGHRANIVNTGFREIGVAVGQTRYEEKTVWLAVQIFATPSSLCPAVDGSAKSFIESESKVLGTLKTNLETLYNQIQDYRPKRGPEYEELVSKYNEKVSEYNTRIDTLDKTVSQYNSQVESVNECIANYTY